MRDKVCQQCQDDLAEIAALRQEAASRKKSKKDRVLLRVEKTYYRWEYMPGHPRGGDELRKCFLALVMAIGERCVTEKKGEHTPAVAYLVVPKETSYENEAFYFEKDVANQLRELFTCITRSIQEAHEYGKDSIRQAFGQMVRGSTSLERFAETMQMEQQDISARVIFSLANPYPEYTRVLLCEVGQKDAEGAAITEERLKGICQAYRDKGVAVEIIGSQLWAVTTVSMDAFTKVLQAANPEMYPVVSGAAPKEPR